MLRGLLKLTWIEIKVFRREPLGAIGTVVFPVVVFLVAGRVLGGRITTATSAASQFLQVGLPVLAAILTVISTVLSLVTIISIYRQDGILKRLRATPLHPVTILTAHVLVKLALTTLTLAALFLLGKRYYPVEIDAPILSFTFALWISTWSILSVGFIIASIVPTARFAQPIGAAIFYPLLGVCGLFVPLGSMPPVVQTLARFNPLTYAVSLLQGIWTHEPWSAHLADIAALLIVFLASTALSARIFRWE